MGVLKAFVNGAWEDISGVTTNEVYVGPDDPRQGLYKNVLLWQDTTRGALFYWNSVAGHTGDWDLVASGYLPLTGGTLSGLLTLSGDPTANLHAATKQYVDQQVTAPGSSSNVAWENGFSGTATLRQNGAVVSCQIERVKRANDVLENQDIRMFAYPSGVPGPWATMIVATSAMDTSTPGWIGWMEECEVQFRSDGVWLQALDNRQINMGWVVSAAATWAK